MLPLDKHQGIVLPLNKANVDTDQIIPKQFLRNTEKQGFGQYLFYNWRYLDDAGTQADPDFVLNQAHFTDATILLARDNFGSGSSREHAAWALADFGIKVILAPSFADIFYQNCFNNGILPVKLSGPDIDFLFTQATSTSPLSLHIDLEQQRITCPPASYDFEITPFNKMRLLKGMDQIGWTLQFESLIEQYETRLKIEYPWV